MKKFKKYILTTSIATISAVLGAGVGSGITGYFLLESNNQQIKFQEAKFKSEHKKQYIDNLVKLYSNFNSSIDALVSLSLSEPKNEKDLMKKLTILEGYGYQLMVLTNDDISNSVFDINKNAAMYIRFFNEKNSSSFLDNLNTSQVNLIKVMKRYFNEYYSSEDLMSNKSFSVNHQGEL